MSWILCQCVCLPAQDWSNGTHRLTHFYCLSHCNVFPCFRQAAHVFLWLLLLCVAGVHLGFRQPLKDVSLICVVPCRTTSLCLHVATVQGDKLVVKGDYKGPAFLIPANSSHSYSYQSLFHTGACLILHLIFTVKCVFWHCITCTVCASKSTRTVLFILMRCIKGVNVITMRFFADLKVKVKCTFSGTPS